MKLNKKTHNLTDIAYDAIKHMIIYNEVEAGEFLSENALAKSLNMSRTPVREALKILASESLVEIHNGVGIFVRNITSREIHELFEVRTALECVAVVTFMNNVKDEEILEIEANWLNVRQRLEKGENVKYEYIAEIDHNFHTLILSRSNNSILFSIMDGIRQRIQRIQALSISRYPYHIDSIDQHLNIIKAIKAKDSKEAQRLLTEHILFSESCISQY
jgi:DNA-binding GntR family transcriptional regulator